ncbi:unnamed protein product [Protopolystoma xenopodis]|uniref:Uncharacterized protein n=1 Tax=Protopolystoma xenopodis TaxID=117903 RepID=A0A3S5AES1_9PLAT|nr:unnamed protein product [Protopolystoma xenopodis]
MLVIQKFLYLTGHSLHYLELTSRSLSNPSLINDCGRRFHFSCVFGLPGVLLSGTGNAAHVVRCSAHVCNTCALEAAASTGPGFDQGTVNSAVASDSEIAGEPLLHCVRYAFSHSYNLARYTEEIGVFTAVPFNITLMSHH